MKKVLLLFAFLCFLSMQIFAQRTVTGTVTGADDGMGLPGVSVAVKGTALGTVTDINGKYTLEVPTEANTLVFSFMGMKTQEVQITGDVVNAALESEDQVIDDVIVTALGVTRDKKSLGYSVQELDGSEVNEVRQTNFVNSLSGKVAGVQVNQSTTMGGSANIVIRGSTSLTGNNQALFVVDGVPIDNTSGVSADIDDVAQSRRGNTDATNNWGGYDYGNNAADINPDDIESISVLRGAAATVLYGSRASNGVILITTKKGKKRKGIGISINSGLLVSNVDKATMPKHQKLYGGGYGPFYEDASSYFFETDLDGDGTQDLIVPTSEDASWGARFDPNLNVIHWDALDPLEDNFAEKRPWVAGANDIEHFFTTGYQWTNNIAFNGGTDNGSFRLSYTNMNQTGNIPNSNIKRHTVNFSGDYKFTPKFTVTTNISYVNNEAVGRYGTGYDGQNVMQSFGQWIQTNVDFKRLEEKYIGADGFQRSWNAGYYDDLHPIYFDNPYWVRHKSYQNDERHRVYGYAKFNYKIADWLEFVGRFANDFYSEVWEQRIAMGSVDEADYTITNRRFNERNVDLMLKFNKNFGDISMNGIVGSNFRQNNAQSVRSSTSGGLFIAEFYSVNNSIAPKSVNETHVLKGVNSIFASFSFGYKNLVYVDLAGRNDWSSTLPEEHNSYFYPSVSASLILSEIGGLKDISALSFAKLRANYAQVGSDAPAYSTRTAYTQRVNWGNQALFSMNSTLQNPNLKPENTKSLEFGLEAYFMNRRFGFDVSYYQTSTYDQILPLQITTATGNFDMWTNNGQIDNWGIELALNTTPVRTADFQWDLNVNWFMNRNEVISLAEGIDNYLMFDNWDVSVNAAVGEPYGTIKGKDFVWTNGKRTVGADGYYLMSDESDVIIGDINPDWNMGITNIVSYKGITFNFLIDWKQGGDIYSINTKYGQATGVYEETAALNDKGVQMRDPVDEGGGVRFDAVFEDGSVNDVYVPAYRWGRAFYYNNSPTARYVFDASYVKLREVSIGYSLPSSVIGKTPFSQITLSVIGRNLWIIHKNVEHFDPEAQTASGNNQGIESGSYPTPRTIGFNIKLGL